MSEKPAQDMTANPAPLGLFGFGLTTVLLNFHNIGLFPMNAMILGMGLFYGGIAQVIAGIMEWKKGNTFGTTAFTSYGLFWISLVALLILPKMGLAEPADKTSMGLYLLMWGVFTFLLFINTLKLHKSLQVVFGLLTALFLLLSLGDLLGNSQITVIAGFVGILTGLSAMYTGVAQVTNVVHKKAVLPI